MGDNIGLVWGKRNLLTNKMNVYVSSTFKVEDTYTFILFAYNTIMHVLIDLNDAGNVLIILTPYFVSCEAPILKLGLRISSK